MAYITQQEVLKACTAAEYREVYRASTSSNLLIAVSAPRQFRTGTADTAAGMLVLLLL